MQSITQTGGDFWRCNHSSKWKPVSDPLGHGYNIGNDAMPFEAPEMLSSATKASLNLIRNENAAIRTDQLRRLLDETLGELHCPTHTLYGLGKHAS